MSLATSFGQDEGAASSQSSSQPEIESSELVSSDSESVPSTNLSSTVSDEKKDLDSSFDVSYPKKVKKNALVGIGATLGLVALAIMFSSVFKKKRTPGW
jgi:hypothetical protein